MFVKQQFWNLGVFKGVDVTGSPIIKISHTCFYFLTWLEKGSVAITEVSSATFRKAEFEIHEVNQVEILKAENDQLQREIEELL